VQPLAHWRVASEIAPFYGYAKSWSALTSRPDITWNGRKIRPDVPTNPDFVLP
jgi:hypothetical protein